MGDEKELDVRGMSCPMPLIHITKFLLTPTYDNCA